MIDEPGWAIVLEAMYEGQKKQIRGQKDPHDETSVTERELADQLEEISRGDMRLIEEYLETCGLIRETNRVQGIYELTPLGFRVAHERKMQERQDEREDARVNKQEEQENRRAKRQQSINIAVAALTLGLMSVTVIDSFVRAAVGAQSIDLAYGVVFGGIVLVVLFAFGFYKQYKPLAIPK